MTSPGARPAGPPLRELRPNDPTRVGPYALEGRIGEGGMGAVYLGRSPDGRPVAVKVVRPELADDRRFLDRFHGEARNAELVASFCTAQVLEHGEDLGLAYMVTEYIEGPSLLQHVSETGPLPPGMLHGVAVGVAAALVAIHAAGLVHRDLKPSNVLLSISGPRVIDFGIARALDEAVSLTRTGQVVGTPGYIAPEQITEQEVTPAVDVFAWGCLVAYAANGRNPFGSGSLHIMLGRAVHAEPELGALTEPMAGLVRRSLEKDPARRPSAQELLLALVGGVSMEAVNTTLGALGPSWSAPLQNPDPGRTATDPGARRPTPTPPPPPVTPEPTPPPTPAPEPVSDPRSSPPAGNPMPVPPPPESDTFANAPTGPAPLPPTEPRAPVPQGAFQHGTFPHEAMHHEAMHHEGMGHEGMGHGTLHGTERRSRSRRTGPLVIVGTVALVAAVTGGAFAANLMRNSGGDQKSGGGTPQSGSSASTLANGIPATPMMVRIDTKQTWAQGQCNSDIGRFTPGAAKPETLVGGNTCDSLPELSHDGTQVAFTRKLSDTRTAAMVVGYDGGTPVQVTDKMSGGRVTWSPDDKRLAFMSKVNDVPQIFTIPAGGGTPKQLTTDSSVKDDPMWSEQGRIAFWSKRSGTEQVYTLDPDNPTEWQQVTSGDVPAVDPEWSPDGTQIAYTRGKYPKGDIWVTGPTGENPRAVVKGGPHDMDPAWSKDGKWLCYVRGPYSTPELRIIRVADGEEDTKLTPKGYTIAHPNW